MKKLKFIIFWIIGFSELLINETKVYADVYSPPITTEISVSFGMLIIIFIAILLLITLTCLFIGKLLAIEKLKNKTKKMLKVLFLIFLFSTLLFFGFGMMGYIADSLFDFLCGLILILGFVLSLYFRLVKRKKFSNKILKITYILFMLMIIWYIIDSIIIIYILPIDKYVDILYYVWSDFFNDFFLFFI